MEFIFEITRMLNVIEKDNLDSVIGCKFNFGLNVEGFTIYFNILFLVFFVLIKILKEKIYMSVYPK